MVQVQLNYNKAVEKVNGKIKRIETRLISRFFYCSWGLNHE